MFIPSPGSHPGKVTRKSGPSHIWSHHRQRDAPHARQTHAQTPMPQHQGQTPRPAARASLPLPIHSVKQQPPSTRDSERREGPKTLANSPTASNEGTRLIRPSRSSRQRASETRFTAAWRTCRGAGGDRRRTLDMGRRSPR